MNSYLAAAAALAFLVGLVHSVLGELMIFRRLRRHGRVPTEGGRALGEGHVRILWASWHTLTAFGWGFAGVLQGLAMQTEPGAVPVFIGQAIVASMLAGSALVLVGTKAKHPGWIGLLGVAVLVWMGCFGT